MKIASTDFLERIQNSSAKAAAADLQEDKGFAKILENRQVQADAAGQGAGSGAAAGLLASGSMVGMILAGQKVENSSGQVGQQVEKTLDTMEKYAAALGDSKVTLKELAPLADDLNKAAGQLTEMSRKLPDNDPMKSISNDTAVMATVEAMKFKRGDYI